MSRQLLFVCTGNFYRSRFAESLFNALAPRARLPWTAGSRGFVLAKSNVGPISDLALDALASRRVMLQQPIRSPIVVQLADLEAADLVIALKEAEHRPWFERLFPEWVERVEYWHIHDLDRTPADEALAMIEREVEHLIARLAAE